MKENIRKLEDKIAQAKLGGGQKRIETQHSKGKLTARWGSHGLWNHCR